jgi:phage tail sheath protein FI
MPEYLSPGVYVEEIDAGPKPIEGVSTSTAGMVGVTARGPVDGKPAFVTSFAEYVRSFGGSVDVDDAVKAEWEADHEEGGLFWQFPLAIKGFFDNGGQLLYVKRVVPKAAAAATAAFGTGIIAEIVQDAAKTSDTVRVRTLSGIVPGAVVTLHVDAQKIDLTVKSYDASAKTVTFTTPLTQPVRNGRDYLELKTAAPIAAAGTLVATASAPGAWGNTVTVRVRPMESATLNLLADPTVANNIAAVTTVKTAAKAGDTDVDLVDAGAFAVNDVVTVAGARFSVAAKAGTKITLATALAADAPVGTAVARVPSAGTVGQKLVWVASAGELYVGALVEIDTGAAKLETVVSTIQGSKVTLADNLTAAPFAGDKLRLVEAEVSVTYAPTEASASAVSEVFSRLRLVDDANNPSKEFIITNVNENSALVTLSPATFSATSLGAFPFAARPVLTPEAGDPPVAGWLPLAGGDDKLETLTVDDFVGIDGGPGKRTGIQSLEDVDDVSLALVPGLWSQTVQSALITHCELLKYRFAILDPRTGLDIEGMRAFREPLDSKYAALYYPWLVARDPFTQEDELVPPSGHLAGIYARVDDERGVWKAPANEIVRSILRFEQDITRREQDVLNPVGIDALRFFPDRGLRVWGARTVSSDPAWRYINVRRLFIFVERSIDVGTQWVVFEPNDETTWARVRQSVSNFLDTIWRAGGLQGKRDEAYFVRCDRTTMSQDDLDNGRLICLVGIAPVKPAEFVIFRIQQKTLDEQQT